MLLKRLTSLTRALALGFVVAGIAACTRQPEPTPPPTAESGPGAPLSEVEDLGTAEALREIARSTNDALREADSEPAPTNAMSRQGTPGDGTPTGEGSATDGDGGEESGTETSGTPEADASDPDDPDAELLALYEPTWANSDPEGLVAAEEGRIGRPALVWFHADW